MKGLRFEVELRNYRCFPQESPARFVLQDDFTAFVGPNNVGKSSLLKFFYETRELWEQLANPNPWSKALQPGESAFANISFAGVTDQLECFSSNNDAPMVLALRVASDEVRTDAVLDGIVVTIARNRAVTLRLLREGQRFTADGHNDWIVQDGPRHPAVDLGPYRDAALVLHQSTYIPSFRHALKASEGQSYDLPIGRAFVTMWDNLKSGGEKVLKQEAGKLTKQIQEVFGFETLEINANALNTNLDVFIDGKPYGLDEVGAGIANFIVCLAFIATRQPSLVFIDEPEANLHPQLQLELLRTLAEYAPHGVVFATHSIGLVRGSAARAYSLRPVQHGVASVSDFHDPKTFAEQLGELSFSAYQELGFSKLLLVEGSTETPSLRELLRRYHEDAQFVVMSLGGSDNIKANAEPQLAEVRRITDDVTVLIDSERTTENAPLEESRQAFVDACENLGIRCHVLKRRSFENYLTDAAIKAVKSDKYRALGPFEKLSDCDPHWAKSENWRIVQEMGKADLDGTDLGDFLESL